MTRSKDLGTSHPAESLSLGYSDRLQRSFHIIHALEKNRLITGSVVQMTEAARGLAARGHRITVVSRPGGDLEDFCATCGVTFIAMALKHPFDLGSIVTLRRFFRSYRVDIVHVHKGRPHSLALFAAIGLGKRPALVVNRGVTFPLNRMNRLKYQHQRVRAVVCVAESIRRSLIASTRLDARVVHTIRSGTDVQRFDPRKVNGVEVRKELGLNDDHLLVGTVSVRDWKGWRELIAAASMIAPGEPNLRLLFVGCEPESERLKVVEEARNASISHHILTLPYRYDMPAVFAACDVVVDASTAGTGITGTIREAMAMERLVVASDIGGNAELVIDGETGLLVPAGDTDALARAISSLLWDQQLRRRLGANARRKVQDSFTTEHRLDKLENLYLDIVKKNESQR